MEKMDEEDNKNKEKEDLETEERDDIQSTIVKIQSTNQSSNKERHYLYSAFNC